MAAASIAKLAVILTADTTQLSANMGRAQGIVRNFNSGIGNSGTLARTAFKQAGDAAALMTGNFAKLGSVAAAVGGAGGPLAIMAAAAGAIAFKLAAISDAQEVASGASATDTWAGQWERASKAAGDIAVTLGRPIAEVLTEETKQMADILAFIAQSIMPDYIREEQRLIALKEKQKAADKERAKAAEAAAKKAADEARELGEYLEKQGRDMQARADAIAQSVRTPREELVGTLAELQQLFDAGFLSAENYRRAAEEAGEKFKEATAIKDKADVQAKDVNGIAAVDRFSMAGFSAVQSGKRELERIEQTSKEQAAELKKQTEIENRIADILNEKLSAPVVLMEGNPP